MPQLTVNSLTARDVCRELSLAHPTVELPWDSDESILYLIKDFKIYSEYNANNHQWYCKIRRGIVIEKPEWKKEVSAHSADFKLAVLRCFLAYVRVTKEPIDAA